MRRIVYYVASSIDGFISGPNEDISGFVSQGNGVEKYLNDLSLFDTVIMGRKTYEFGYKFGLVPGRPAYQNMMHYIFSETLSFESQDNKVKVCKPDLAKVDELKYQSGSDIYLCGGGQFAGWLLEHERIDILKLKLNPLIQGAGVKLFDGSTKKYQLNLLDHGIFENSLQIMTYQVRY